MTITIAGALIAVYVIYLFATNMHRAETLLLRLFTINLIYEGFINAGYFITLSTQTFKVADLLQFVCALLSMLILMKKGFKGSLIAFVATILMSVAMLLVNPLNEMVRTFNGIDFVDNIKYMHYPSFDLQTVKTSLRLICFAINATAVAVCMTRDRWEKLLELYLKAGRIVIMYAWVEFVLKNIIHTTVTDTVIGYLFGVDRTIMSELERNGLFVITGFNNEPSQFCMMLYSYYLVYLMSRGYLRQTKAQIGWTLSGLVQMLLCGSFRIVGLLPVLLVLYLIVNRKNSRSILLVCVLSLAAVILYYTGALDYYLERLGRALLFAETLDASISGGEAGRLNTIIEAFQLFEKRPVFGIGPGQTFAFGFIPSMLAMTGLAGLAAWYALMFGTVGRLGESRDQGRWLAILLVISVSWIYTDSIAIGYSIYVIPMALSIRYEPDAPMQTVPQQNSTEASQIHL